jgi:cysteinyl-tRNA synthetase
VRTFNALGFVNKKKKNATHKGNSELFLTWIQKYGEMAALFNSDPTTMLNRLDDILIEMKGIDKEAVETLVSKRNSARDSKDWDLADKVRAELEVLGVELFDGHERGWKVKVND